MIPPDTKRPEITFAGGKLLRDQKPVKLIFVKDGVVQIGCTEISQAAVEFLIAEYNKTKTKTNERKVMMTVQSVARICHETNRAYCNAQGDSSQDQWESAPEWQKQSAMNGVIFHRNNPEATAEASHNNWLEQKLAEGWVYGPEKNPTKKEHPCCVRFERLPLEQQAKDRLFKGIIDSLRELIEPAEATLPPPVPAEKAPATEPGVPC